MVSGSQYQALMEMLEQPEQDNAGLRDLFARKAPWESGKMSLTAPEPLAAAPF